MRHLEAANRELEHRREKREREMRLVLLALAPFLPGSDGAVRHILEFGAGDGFQIPYLQKIGQVSALEPEPRESLLRIANVEAVFCGIEKTPFLSGRFDLIFSNHVIEHLENLPESFQEIRRIGKPDCIYAFSVPTSLWLLLSLPAQYRNRLHRFFERDSAGASSLRLSKDGHGGGSGLQQGRVPGAGWSKFLPRGHGVQENFLKCWNLFRVSQWQHLFETYGFNVVKKQPLLLYGPSEFPIVPTLDAASAGGLCSSMLFVMRKQA